MPPSLLTCMTDWPPLLALELPIRPAVQYSGGLRGVALLWSEFVLEVRWHWEHLTPLPLVSVDEGKPDMRWMLLHQKLQMINCCIQRQLQRNLLTKKKKKKQAGSGGQGAEASSDDPNFSR